MADDDLSRGYFVGWLMGRRGAKPWRGRARTRPKMPSGPWRLAAVTVTAIGVLLGLAAAVSFGWSATRWAIIGAVAGFVIGMYAVETVYERRVAELGDQPGDGPIGPRT